MSNRKRFALAIFWIGLCAVGVGGIGILVSEGDVVCRPSRPGEISYARLFAQLSGQPAPDPEQPEMICSRVNQSGFHDFSCGQASFGFLAMVIGFFAWPTWSDDGKEVPE